MLQVHSFIIFCKTLSEFWDFQFYALISLLFFLFLANIAAVVKGDH